MEWISEPTFWTTYDLNLTLRIASSPYFIQR